MKNNPELIVMLTKNDRTVKNAWEVFEECKDAKAVFWGFKEKGLSLSQMKELFSFMKKCGKTTVLEVVAYTEQECIEGARTAVKCDCDILMGTVYFDSVNEILKEHSIKYMPFVGKVTERPSVLQGSIDEIVEQAEKISQKGVFGFDLLGYRYPGNANELNRNFVSRTKFPVCIAGSVNSMERLREIKEISPWTFTVGGAFFENRFGGTIKEQIDTVCDFMNE